MSDLIVFPGANRGGESNTNVQNDTRYPDVFKAHAVNLARRTFVEDALHVNNLDWEVKEKPVHLEVAPMCYEVIPNQKAIVRADTGESLGIVKDRFKPIQNRDAFAILNPLIEEGFASISSCGSFYGGSQVWMQVEFDTTRIPFWDEMQNLLDDRILAKALLYDHKAGTGSAFLANMNERFFCSNQLHSILSDGIKHGGLVKAKHVGNVTGRLEARAESMFKQYLQVAAVVCKRYILLHNTKLTRDDFKTLVLDVIAPNPDDMDRDDFSSYNRYIGAMKRAGDKRSSVEDLWTSGVEHKGNNSSWEALNGAIEAIDHDPHNIFRTRKDKVLSLVSGPDAKMKNEITKNLVIHAASLAA